MFSATCPREQQQHHSGNTYSSCALTTKPSSTPVDGKNYNSKKKKHNKQQQHSCSLYLPSFLPPISTWTLDICPMVVTRESTLLFTASCECLNVTICWLISASLFCFSITLAACTDARSALISSFNFSSSSLALLSLSKAILSWSLRLCGVWNE